MESKTVGRVPNRAAVGWKSPNSSISSNSSSSTSDESSAFSTLPTRSVKAPNSKPTNQINSPQFHTIAHHQIPSKSQQFRSIESTQQAVQSNNAVNCKKSPMLRRMKLALAEAENKNRMNSFQTADQTDSVIPVNQTISQMSMNQCNPNLKNQNCSTWQNSTRKGTVKADEDFEFQGFPKPPPQFFPPPPTSIANEVPVQSSISGPSISPNKEFLDHQPIEIKRIPLIFKAPSPKSPDYKNEKTCVLDELKQKQESGIGTGNGPIYKKNRSPMLRRMKLALAHIENESDL